MKRLQVWIIVALIVVCTPMLRAQSSSDSHYPLRDGARKPRDLANQLQQGLGQPPIPQQADPEFLKKLQELFGKGDPNAIRDRLQQDPELLRRLEEFAKQNPEIGKLAREQLADPNSQNNPDKSEKIGELLRKLQQEQIERQKGTNIRPPDTGPSPAPITTPEMQRGAGARSPTPPGPVGDIKVPNKDERWQNFARGMEKWLPKTSRDSELGKKMMDRLGKSDFSKKADERFKNGPRVNWDRVGQRLKGSSRFFERNLGKIDPNRVGRAPKINSPRIPEPNLPSMSPPSGPSMGGLQLGGTATILMMLAALALVGFLLWRYLLKPLKQWKKAESDALGPWPIEPAKVRTRAELVTAVNYLALLKCGKPAKVWHHREVANRLGAEDDRRRHSAVALADVYERARYAPLQEDLAADQMDRARRELCFLAGVDAP